MLALREYVSGGRSILASLRLANAFDAKPLVYLPNDIVHGVSLEFGASANPGEDSRNGPANISSGPPSAATGHGRHAEPTVFSLELNISFLMLRVKRLRMRLGGATPRTRSAAKAASDCKSASPGARAPLPKTGRESRPVSLVRTERPGLIPWLFRLRAASSPDVLASSPLRDIRSSVAWDQLRTFAR